MNADVRLISRGMTGVTKLEGIFEVIHKELAQDGRISLVCRDQSGVHLVLYIRPEVLEDVEPASPVSPESVTAAEDRVLARHAL